MENECRDIAVRTADEIEQHIGDMYEYLSGMDENGDYNGDEVLDYRFIIDSNKNYLAVKAFVTLGGPTTWIDTEEGAVICHWGTQQGECGLSRDAIDAIDAVFREHFENY